MIDINNYILEKLHIGSNLKNKNYLCEEVISLFWGTDDKYFIANAKDNLDEAIDRINEWIKLVDANEIEYVSSFDINSYKKYSYFNCNNLKSVNAKEDADKVHDAENDLCGDSTTKYIDTSCELNIRGNRCHIIFNKKYLYLTMYTKNDKWLTVVGTKK